MTADFTVGVVGNPNCGKTTLFNALTGAKQSVGNWPGVTVEKKTGEYVYDGKTVELVDLPGTYSLEASDDQISLDEKVARDFVASNTADLIINIVDAANIERHLYLTSQLMEMRVPMILALNMMDVVKKRGIKIDTATLSEHLGCPIVSLTATAKQGINDLKKTINQVAASKPIPQKNVHYSPVLEHAIAGLSPLLSAAAADHACDARWLALRLLEGDTLASKIAGPEFSGKIAALQIQIEQDAGEEIDILAADARYGFVNQITQNTVCKNNEISRHTTEKIDAFVLNRILGIPVFLLVIYAMFMFTINFGSAFVDFFDQITGALLIDGLGLVFAGWGFPDWLNVLVTHGIGGGIQVVATFIPIVGCLFLFLSALEDSGYMARAAFVMDRFMRMLGLPGKSFVPMIVGFGCNVPAIMATRTLENPRDRILTNLMNPFMSCGARLPVYALFAAAFFPVGGQNLVFGLYLLGIGAAILTGLIMRHTLFKGEASPFIMELPLYHFPTLRGMLTRTWDRLKSFLFDAGKVIVPMVLVLNFLNALGTDGRFGNENNKQSVLSEIGRNLTPIFEPMGINYENWPATVGIFTGVLAKEAVVGTLSALYDQMGKPTTSGAQDDKFEISSALLAAAATIPENLAALADKVLDPLGLSLNAAEKDLDITNSAYATMREKFDGQAGAFAYLLFILLYTPCVAATAAIYRETGRGWTLFILAWTTGLAFVVATIFYQLATFVTHPAVSSAWILGLISAFTCLVVALRQYGKQTMPLVTKETVIDSI